MLAGWQFTEVPPVSNLQLACLHTLFASQTYPSTNVNMFDVDLIIAVWLICCHHPAYETERFPVQSDLGLIKCEFWRKPVLHLLSTTDYIVELLLWVNRNLYLPTAYRHPAALPGRWDLRWWNRGETNIWPGRKVGVRQVYLRVSKTHGGERSDFPNSLSRILS